MRNHIRRSDFSTLDIVRPEDVHRVWWTRNRHSFKSIIFQTKSNHSKCTFDIRNSRCKPQNAPFEIFDIRRANSIDTILQWNSISEYCVDDFWQSRNSIAWVLVGSFVLIKPNRRETKYSSDSVHVSRCKRTVLVFTAVELVRSSFPTTRDGQKKKKVILCQRTIYSTSFVYRRENIVFPLKRPPLGYCTRENR